MSNKTNTNRGWWERVKQVFKTNTSLTVIISAVLLLELMMGLMFYAAQNFIQRTMERMVRVEMNAIYLCIRNKLANVEVTIDNLSWVVSESLNEPDWMFDVTKQMVSDNPIIYGSGIAFTPYYYRSKGKLYEPYSVRRGGDSIVTMQVGRNHVIYTNKEYYRVPVTTGKSLWSEPYEDKVGVIGMTTTYSSPVRDTSNKIVGVIFADIPTRLLEDIMNEEKVYKTTQRFLVTGSYNKLVGEDTPLFQEILKLLKVDNDKTDYFTTKDKDGNKYHVFYTPVGGKTDWVLINIVNDNEVFSRLRMMRLMLMLPLSLGLIFSLFIVWRSSRNLNHLRRINAEKERIDGELRVASEIQQSMLPQGEITVENLELEGFLKPAREVGGDIYDYYVRDEKLFFCIGDVSGKGAPAAMLMAVVQALFRSASAHESNPARIILSINEAACQNNKSNMFVTMFVGVLDLPTGHLRYCDAGHDAPLLMEDGKWKQIDAVPHLPVGVFADTKYEMQTLTLLPSSTIFLYTDGLTEAKDAARKQFGLERIMTILEESTDDEPKDILANISDAVDKFVKNAEQSDDLTMLAIKYHALQFESTLTETLTIKNDVHEVKRFSEFMKSAIEKLNVDTSLARQLRLAVEEAVVNVIDYAYPIDSEGDIIINMMYDGNTLRFQIIDTGVAFDPTAKQRTDTTLSAEDRQIGGLGILLVRELMDSINYERIDGKNILTLIKNINNK